MEIRPTQIFGQKVWGYETTVEVWIILRYILTQQREGQEWINVPRHTAPVLTNTSLNGRIP